MEGEENKKRNIMKTITKWNESDKKKLIELYQLGYALPEIGDKINRSRFAVESEMHLLRRAGRVSYRTSESKALANQNGLFKPDSVEFEDDGIDPVEFEDHGIKVRLSANDEETEGTEQAERAERKAITTENQMTEHIIKYQNDCPDSIRDAMTAKTARTNSVFNEILENIKETHDKKNDDYKDSYSDTMKRFGTKSGLVRIYDKFNRIENILDSEGKANFESAEDNLQDLATYAIMMLEYIKKGGNK